MKTANKKTISEFESKAFEFSQEEINQIAETNGNVFSVISGLHEEVFGVQVIDDSKIDFDYIIFYISKIANQIKGYYLELKPSQNNRNELVSLFSSFITSKFGKQNQQEFERIFNAFQYYQIPIYEKYGFNVIDNSIANVKGELAIKYHGKGVIFIPMILKDEINIKEVDLTKIRDLKSDEHFVYLMYNTLTKSYKIGKTRNKRTLKFREKTLQSQEPEVLTLDVWIVKENYEKRLHLTFSEQRKRGEWFDLNKENLEELRKIMRKFACR